MVQRELDCSRGGSGDIDTSKLSATSGESPHDEARILLIGDEGVGKSSLIYSLVYDEHEPNLPAKMAEMSLPGDMTPENVPMRISDYSTRDPDDDLAEAIRSSNVVCIVYDATDDESLERVASHWIPTVRQCQETTSPNESRNRTTSCTYRPIILVANKVDLVDEDKPLGRVREITEEFVDVEAFIEVSALSQKNVVELFSTAQKSISCPLAPLFDPKARVLTRKCRDALIYIFKMCDYDQDDLLNDNEMNIFQQNCFGTPLQRDALEDLKLIIEQSTLDGVVDDSLTQSGFLFIHALSIEKGRHDFTWQVLRKFNYDNQLNLVTRVPQDDSTILVHDASRDNYRVRNRFSSHGSQSPSASLISTSSEAGSSEIESMRDMDLNAWLREHSNLVRVGVGVTLATLVSLLALKFVLQGSASTRS